MRKLAAIIIGLYVGLCAAQAMARNGQYLFREMARYQEQSGASPYQVDPYTSDLIARWDFDAVAWTNDVTSNGYNLGFAKSGGAVSNLVVGTNIYGRQEKAAYFSGQSLRREMTGSEAQSWSNETSVMSFWFLRSLTNAQHYAWGIGGTNASADLVTWSGDANSTVYRFLVRSNATTLSQNIPSQSASSLGWHHYADYRSSLSGSIVWIDGVKVATGTGVGDKYAWADVAERLSSIDATLAISIGDRPGAAQSWRGYIDNARAYRSGQATNNVQWLYQNTHPTNCLEAR